MRPATATILGMTLGAALFAAGMAFGRFALGW